ncbi:MAG: endolytic transglycosylase MltG [Bacteroidales bacterium]|nr:endolytic transglycosylase MltG [Bacteroidales bacterium]MBN2819835.1 endolytic transglycosylase MltG [Bacteroidales bacterium]
MSASRIVKISLLVLLAVFIIVAVKFLDLYKKAYSPNINNPSDKEFVLFIYSGWTYDSVINAIELNHYVKNISSFKWAAKKKNYANHVYPGRYVLEDRMSNNDIINKLRSGSQDVLNITFNNIRTLEELAERISDQLEPSGNEFLETFNDSAVYTQYGFTYQTFPAMFIPNTYEFYWNTSAKRFVEKMYDEYERFWNKQRTFKAGKIGLTPVEVATLASIVEGETIKEDEKADIAGVYINRLEKGMRLQADPTVKFAINDFTIRRVLRKHYQTDSPYNTYKYAGLPPGPICLPEISSIEAVLNYTDHNYMYFCAKSDFSGYHAFARTISEHNKNASAYQRELNKRRIYK